MACSKEVSTGPRCGVTLAARSAAVMAAAVTRRGVAACGSVAVPAGLGDAEAEAEADGLAAVVALSVAGVGVLLAMSEGLAADGFALAGPLGGTRRPITCPCSATTSPPVSPPGTSRPRRSASVRAPPVSPEVLSAGPPTVARCE